MSSPLVDAVAESAPPAGDFVQIGATQTLFPGGAEQAREQFRQYHAIRIAKLLEPAFLQTVMRACETTQFGLDRVENGARDVPGFREVELSPQRVGRVLNLALERPAFLRWLEDTTQCGPLGSLAGRLTQTLNRPGDELRWHDDVHVGEGRRLAIVIHLGTTSYEGGDFALRRKGGATLWTHQYTQPGEALIFKVDPELEHRVRPLTSGGPRRVFAGWAFRAGRI